MEQQKDHSVLIASLNEQLSVLKESNKSPKEDLPVNLNESIILELNTELNEKKVFYIISDI